MPTLTAVNIFWLLVCHVRNAIILIDDCFTSPNMPYLHETSFYKKMYFTLATVRLYNLTLLFLVFFLFITKAVLVRKVPSVRLKILMETKNFEFSISQCCQQLNWVQILECSAEIYLQITLNFPCLSSVWSTCSSGEAWEEQRLDCMLSALFYLVGLAPFFWVLLFWRR